MADQLRPLMRSRLYEVIVEQLCSHIADNEMVAAVRDRGTGKVASVRGATAPADELPPVRIDFPGGESVRSDSPI